MSVTVIDGANTTGANRLVSYQKFDWVARYGQVTAAGDAVCALIAGAVGFSVRFGGQSWTPWTYLWVALGLPLIWVPWLVIAGAYDGRFFGSGSDEYRRVLHAGVSLTALVAVVSYGSKAEVARGFVLITLPLVTLLCLITRYRLRKRLHRRRSAGDCMQRVVAVGHRHSVEGLIRELGRTTHHGMKIVAVCVPDPTAVRLGSVPVLGDLEEIPRAVFLAGADAVAVLACPELDGVALRRLAWQLEKTNTEIFVAPALLEVAGPRTTIRPIAGLPLMHVDHPKLAGPRRALKRVFDVAVAGTALLLLAPLMVLMALIIQCTDPGPALFVQTRIGHDGRAFAMIKFRTMIDGAHRARAALASRNHGDGVLFKLKDDPRVTRVGAWLRRYSIDELPQLFNVLRGDMSLVGPRPPLPEEVDQYGEDVLRRLVVKPGLTGLWQVSGRSDLPWDEAIRLDLQYVENWSLVLDLQILWKTISAVRSGSGAY
jgi:exopolysaccharide biosynthesis polyprenyl glycosylphosphotransferase